MWSLDSHIQDFQHQVQTKWPLTTWNLQNAIPGVQTEAATHSLFLLQKNISLRFILILDFRSVQYTTGILHKSTETIQCLIYANSKCALAQGDTDCSTHTLNVCHRGLMPSCHTGELCLYCCCRQTCCSCWGGTLQLWSPLSAPPCWQAWYLQYLQQLVKELPPEKWDFLIVFFGFRQFQKCYFRLVGPRYNPSKS